MPRKPITRRRRRATPALLGLLALLAVALSPSPAVSDAALGPAVDLHSAGDPVIAAAGDIACDPAETSPSRCDSSDTAELIEEMDPLAVLALGDLQYPTGLLSDFQNAYEPTWGSFKSITYPAVGDNEYLSSSGATGYFDYWNGKGDQTGRAGQRGKGYYSFDIGTWHVVALNSEISRSSRSAQASWLKADLAAHANTCTLAYWHEPLFSSDQGHETPSMRPLFEILYDAGADLVLDGHHHTYERFAPQDPDGHADPQGIRQITVGTGGKSVTGNDGSAPNSERSGRSFGVLKLTLHPDSYDWQFVPTGKGFTDAGTTRCSGPANTGGATSATSATPGAAARGTSEQVTVSGTGFSQSSTVDFGAGIAVGSVRVDSSDRLTATIQVAPDAALGARNVTISAPGGAPAVCSGCFAVVAPGSVLIKPASAGGGYRLVASDGGIFAFGDAAFKGSTGGIALNKPIVAMASTPSGNGYWLVASDGGIFAFGDAVFRGSTGSTRLNRPIVAMASTPSGNGYWLVAADGGIFAFGDAQFQGSAGGTKLAQPIVGMAATPTGRGYWLLSSDGGIFAFGDAAFKGSTGGTRLNRPIVAMAPAPGGNGYWLTASDGGIFAFGDAAFKGSTGALKLAQPIVTMAATASGMGYWLVASDGGIFAFGDAPFLGSTGGTRLAKPIVGMGSRPGS